MTTDYPHGQLGARLRAARSIEGVSVQEAARLCEVPVWQYLSFETGKRKVPATGLVALQSEHGVDREWVVTGASLADRLMMLSDEDLVRACDFAPEDHPAGSAPTAVQLRTYIANSKKTDRRWAASVELVLQPPAKVSLRDRVDSWAEFGFRAGSFMFAAQFAVLLVVLLLISAGGLKVEIVQGLLAGAMALSMLVIGGSLIIHTFCLEAEKRVEPPVESLPLPASLNPSSFSEPSR